MNKNAIKKYAIWARRELIDRVSKKALRFGISPEGNADPKADSVNGDLLSDIEKKQRSALIKKIAAHGYEQTMEEVAYTWFNRFAALRFMEVNGYLPSHVRVFTNDAGEFKPQILAEAIHLELPGLDMDKVYALKEADKTEELFRYLIIVQCNALSEILPDMFQRIEDFTELLLPDNLLREGSVIERLVTEIPEEDWRDQVQIIGWLYQYYNTEPKDKVFADLKKNIKVSKEKIPAATQLFTPDWIVRYMVENSLGRLWLEGHPNDTLKADWRYYLDEAEQEPEVQKQLAEIRKEYANIKPEDIRCIDPCMGSGHILCYLFDVLMQIYQDYGHTPREAVASILQNNLYGLDIDDRAAQLAYFAVMMKARQYDRRFFSRHLQPKVMAIQESNGLRTWSEVAGDSLIGGQLNFDDSYIQMVDYLIETFHDAKEYGSILTVEPNNYDILLEFIECMKQEDGNLLFKAWINEIDQRIVPLIEQAKMLSAKYDVVVTNPPYMGSSNMSAKLSAFVKKNYPDSKSDLFACFIERCGEMSRADGYVAMITMQSWMFLSSFELLRKNLLQKQIISLVQIGYNSFPEINSKVAQAVSFVIQNTEPTTAGCYLDLTNKYPQAYDKEQAFFAEKDIGGYVATQENFAKIPGAPVAYWVKEVYLNAYQGLVLSDISNPCKGIDTGNNDLFLRFWFEPCNTFGEVPICNKWYPYNKGGSYRKWYGNNEYVIYWGANGNKLREYRGSNLRNKDYYFEEGITWSTVTSADISLRYFGRNYLFDNGGCCLFAEKNIFYIQGLLNSIVGKTFLAISPTINFQPGDVGKVPYIFSNECSTAIKSYVKENISLSKTDWDSFETSWDFERHPLLPTSTESATLLSDCYQKWEQECNDRFTTLKQNEEELNRIFIDIYGLQDELTPEVEDKDVTVRKADLGRDIRSFISYAVGCMMGRYSLDVPGLAYAGGEWDGSKYKTFLPDKDAILPITDDEYFDDDILARFVEFMKVVYGADTLEENLQFIADALGGRGTPREVIRNYFLTGFYADHVKTYQKRPIYWLFDSGKKNGFKCLVYMHRYRPDTIARIRTDYVHEQQSRYRTAIESLENGKDNAATAAERVKLGKKLAAMEAQAKELREYEEKIHHLADQMIAIDLDDGVKHNYAIFKDVLAKIK